MALAVLAVAATATLFAASAASIATAGRLALSLVLAGLFWIAVEAVRRSMRRTAGPERHAASHAPQLRVLWRVTGEFARGGWARHELEQLRLISRNVDGWVHPSRSLELRLDAVITRVLSGVLDRADDVAQLARRMAVAPLEARRVERAVGRLAELLVVRGPATDGPNELDSGAVVRDATEIIAGCTAIRDALRPLAVTNVAPLLAAIDGALTARRLDIENLELDLLSVGNGERALVSPVDLLDALVELLHRVAKDRRPGTVRLTAVTAPREIEIRVSWCARAGLAEPAADLLVPLRRLAGYGVRVVEAPQRPDANGEIRFTLPRADPGASRPTAIHPAPEGPLTFVKPARSTRRR